MLTFACWLIAKELACLRTRPLDLDPRTDTPNTHVCLAVPSLSETVTAPTGVACQVCLLSPGLSRPRVVPPSTLAR